MSDLFTLAYTGSRQATRNRVHHDLGVITQARGRFRLLVGYNPETDQPQGGDRYAYEYSTLVPGVIAETYPAPWHIPALAKAAGPYRNGFMAGLAVGRGGDYGMLAHLHPGSTGSEGAAAFAEHIGMRVWRQPAR
ncbi:hypothetical protein ABZ470_39910 [Streptosporangium sp. NPDC020072]|uniref:hypothetical protein n=1 Tax=Streptosporangium sp. NPDC020072 TaxID=3154788 RepID=UPI00342CD4E8